MDLYSIQLGCIIYAQILYELIVVSFNSIETNTYGGAISAIDSSSKMEVPSRTQIYHSHTPRDESLSICPFWINFQIAANIVVCAECTHIWIALLARTHWPPASGNQLVSIPRSVRCRELESKPLHLILGPITINYGKQVGTAVWTHHHRQEKSRPPCVVLCPFWEGVSSSVLSSGILFQLISHLVIIELRELLAGSETKLIMRRCEIPLLWRD